MPPMSLPEDLVEQARRDREQQALMPIVSNIDGLIRQGMGGLEAVAKGAAEQVAPVMHLLQGGELKLPTLDDLTPEWMRPKPVQAATMAPAQTPATLVDGRQQVQPRMQPGEQMGNVSITQGTGDLRSWARSEAQRLNIDPDIAERVAMSEGGFDDPVRQSDVVYRGEREQSYGPYQLNVNGGLGNEAIARGIDPRRPENARAAVTFALEHAARNGWGNFHGAARVGVGQWDGIGQQPASRPQATTPQPAEQTQAAMAQGQYAAGSWTPNQINAATAEGLDYETALAVCGPAAAIAFARKNGRNPSMQEAVALAREVGWTPDAGMAGPASQQKLLQRMGVAARLEDGSPNWQAVAADVQRGNPVTISTPGHYFVAERYDPESGAFDFGQSAAVLKASGGRTWFRPEELANLGMGEARATLYIDNPNSPSPSVAAGRMSMNTAAPVSPPGAADTSAGAGAAPPPAPASTPPPAPWAAETDAGGGLMMKSDGADEQFMPGKVHPNVVRAFQQANGRPPTAAEAAELAALGYGVA